MIRSRHVPEEGLMVNTVVGEVQEDELLEALAALVAPDDLIFALGRQYSTLAETAGLLFTPRPFRTLEDACAWLGVDPDSLP